MLKKNIYELKKEEELLPKKEHLRISKKNLKNLRIKKLYLNIKGNNNFPKKLLQFIKEE